MRKPLLLAAALSSAVACAVFGSSASAQTAAPDFAIDATQQGKVDFSGSGTAQFNNSLGTNNSFQVGSATSLGVNASASSTPEYAVTSTATLNLDNATNLTQTIGTSGVGNSKTATNTRAHDVTRNSMYESGWTAEWESGRDYNGRTYDSQSAYESAYNAEYNSTYQNAYSNIKGTESTSTSDGTISGAFTTAEFTNETETDTMPAGAKNTESNVTVNGIGSTANIVAAGDSTFDTKILAGQGSDSVASTSTASGSAGASLSTVSLANQSQSTTASAFIQSFGGAQ